MKIWKEDVVNGVLDITRFEERIGHNYNDIRELSAHGIKELVVIPYLPQELLTFDIVDCGLKELPPLPDSLINLWCWCNKLSFLPDTLPPNLSAIDCSGNPISEFSKEFPETLDEIHIRCTYINHKVYINWLKIDGIDYNTWVIEPNVENPNTSKYFEYYENALARFQRK